MSDSDQVPDSDARPTTEVRDVLLSSMDRMFAQLLARVEGLTEAEYLWEPAPGAWSVRPAPDGTPTVVGAGMREIDPAPVTTIAWRLWHIAIDCFDDYTRRFSGDHAVASAEWTLDPGEAITTLQAKWHGYRSHVADLDWWSELGPSWEYLSHHSVADMAMHASNELVHHGAEIGLLRDIYRSSTA